MNSCLLSIGQIVCSFKSEKKGPKLILESF